MLTKNAKIEKLSLQTLQTHQLMPLYSLDPATLQKELPLKTFGKKPAQKLKKLSKIKKMLLTNTAYFNFPDTKAPLALTSDASLVAVEAPLKQYV